MRCRIPARKLLPCSRRQPCRSRRPQQCRGAQCGEEADPRKDRQGDEIGENQTSGGGGALFEGSRGLFENTRGGRAVGAVGRGEILGGGIFRDEHGEIENSGRFPQSAERDEATNYTASNEWHNRADFAATP